jgi:hypothetical protein
MQVPDREPAPLERDKARAFEQLTQVGRLLDAGRAAEGAAAAQLLLSLIVRRADDEALAGFGAMGLDAAFWLLAHERDRDAMRIAGGLAQRLAAGAASEQAIAAGARFIAAQAAGRLGLHAQARANIEALCEMGEPALAALDRLAGRLVAAGAAPAWHAQLAAASVTVLWRLGRATEARAIAEEAAAAFARLGQPQLQQMLLALAAELADG